MTTANLIETRQATHGDPARNLSRIQTIKETFRSGTNWPELGPVHRECLEMFACKIGRILEGDPNAVDHWADIAGYSEIGRRGCANVTGTPQRGQTRGGSIAMNIDINKIKAGDQVQIANGDWFKVKPSDHPAANRILGIETGPERFRYLEAHQDLITGHFDETTFTVWTEPAPLQLRVGGKYVNRRGWVVEIVEHQPFLYTYPWIGSDGEGYCDDGQFYVTAGIDDRDLIAEAPAPALPEGLPPLPDGAVLVDGTKATGDQPCWILDEKNGKWIWNVFCFPDNVNTFAAPADSEIARLNGKGVVS